MDRETSLIRNFYADHTETETSLIVLHLNELMFSHSSTGISDYLKDVNSIGDREVGVFGPDGRPAFGTQPSEIMKSLPDQEQQLPRTDNKLIFQRRLPNERRCHACHSPEDNTRGTVVISHSTEKMDREIRATVKRIVLFALFLGISSELFLMVILRKMILGPLETLNRGALMLKEGKLDRRLEKKTDDEIGSLVSCFNETAESLENARTNLENAVQQRTKELKTAAELTVHLLRADTSLDALTVRFLAAITKDLGYRFAAVCLLERDTGTLFQHRKVGTETDLCEREMSLVSDHPFAQAVREAQATVRKAPEIGWPDADGTVVIIPIVSRQRSRCSTINLCTLESCPAYANPDDRCWLTENTLCRSPLSVAGREKIYGCVHCPVFPVLGVLIAGRADTVTETSLQSLEIIASELTTAMENQRFIDGKKQDIENLVSLHDISVDVLQDLDLNKLGRSIAFSAVAFANADASVLYLKDTDGSFHLETTSGVEREYLPESVPADESFIRIQTEKGYISETVKVSEAPCLHDFLVNFGFHYASSVPMMYKGDLYGWLLLLRRRDFFMTESEKAIIQLFSSQSAAAIHSARIYRSLEESEQRYRDLIDDAHDAIYTLSIEGAFMSLNPAFERITGWQRDEWIGKVFTPIVHPDDLPVAMELFIRALRGDVPPLFELRIRTRSGGYVVGEFKIIPRMVEGKPKYVLGIGRDITERKHAEEERTILISHLNMQKEFSDAIFNTMTMGVMVLDREGSMIRINQAGTEILKIEPADVIHCKLAEVLPGLLEFLVVNDELGRETRFAAGSHMIPIGFTNSPLLDLNGQQRGIVVVFRDLTEIKKLQAEVRRKEHLAAIGRVLAGVAHEIRNPLFGISSIAQILACESTSSGHKDLVQALLKESGRMSRLMEELLLYTRTSRLDVTEFVLESLLKEIHYSIQEKRPDIRISNLIPPDLLIRADMDKMKQILLNLINNAIDAARSSVRISARTGEGYTEISIEDDGTGIPEQDREKIFEPFFTTKKGGTGLGLPICKKIVEDHGGSLRVGSSAGGGALITLTLRT